MEHTSEELAVAEALGGILGEDRWRCGVLVLGCAQPDLSKGNVRIVSAAMMKPSVEAGVDLIYIIKRLRQLADELDAKMQSAAAGKL